MVHVSYTRRASVVRRYIDVKMSTVLVLFATAGLVFSCG